VIEDFDFATIDLQYTAFLETSQGSADGFDRKTQVTADILTRHG